MADSALCGYLIETVATFGPDETTRFHSWPMTISVIGTIVKARRPHGVTQGGMDSCDTLPISAAKM